MRFNILYILLTLLLGSCSKKEVARPHLHNYPFLDDCPSIQSKSIDNEVSLKAKAKLLNIRYVDYLHLLTKQNAQARLTLSLKNNNLTNIK